MIKRQMKKEIYSPLELMHKAFPSLFWATRTIRSCAIALRIG